MQLFLFLWLAVCFRFLFVYLFMFFIKRQIQACSACSAKQKPYKKGSHNIHRPENMGQQRVIFWLGKGDYVERDFGCGTPNCKIWNFRRYLFNKSLHGSLWKTHHKATIVTCHMRSHSVTFHSTQVNAPRVNSSQVTRYSIYQTRRMEGWVDFLSRKWTEQWCPSGFYFVAVLSPLLSLNDD